MVEDDHPRRTSNRDIKKLQVEAGQQPCPNDDCTGVLERAPIVHGGTRYQQRITMGAECTDCSYYED